MKKILYQKTISKTSWISDYIATYIVPTWMYASISSIYINSNNLNNDDNTEYNFNIRIVKNWDPINPMLLSTAEDQQREMNKNIIISRPNVLKKDFPIVLKDICMSDWDTIVIQSNIPWISMSVFWEELQYDSDDFYIMHRDRMIAIYNKMEEQRLVSDSQLWNIVTAIWNIQACSTWWSTWP